MEGTVENRAARDIVATMGEKVLFAYIPEMEISVPESDRKIRWTRLHVTIMTNSLYYRIYT